MKQFRSIAILFPLVMFSPLAIDIFLPALPTMANVFNANAVHAQWSITVFIFSLGLGQLILGPISDRIGRRPVVLFGIILYLLTAFVISQVNTLPLHLVVRFFQGLATCAIVVGVFASVTDRFNAVESSKVYSYLNGVLFCVPALAPILGYHLTSTFGWQSNFIFLGLFALVFGLVAYKGFEESNLTLKKNKTIFAIASYKQVLVTPSFIYYSTIVMLSMASITAFVSTAPNLFAEHYRLPAETFTFWFSINAVAIIAVSFLMPKLLEKHSINGIIRFGMAMVVISGFLFIGLSHLDDVIYYMLTVILCSMGFAFVTGTCVGKALAPFKANAGVATALLGVIQMSVSALLVTSLQALSLSAVEQMMVYSFAVLPLLMLKVFSPKFRASIGYT
ncbi:Bcr/CflA family efflux MFS transporter [Parashewanella curva]|uniref:Bcr/CflA family efflux transporter n=1 Tax=Parashewanella curva TaxID=2338552 RepID=A0A3L8PXK3_9GAMM|nr:multidrug effflux MFS transporter [Parashewanella curva]RLV59529.1 Bcr/CflA family efflux MFS transporter [Parashewanella curva]